MCARLQIEATHSGSSGSKHVTNKHLIKLTTSAYNSRLSHTLHFAECQRLRCPCFFKKNINLCNYENISIAMILIILSTPFVTSQILRLSSLFRFHCIFHLMLCALHYARQVQEKEVIGISVFSHESEAGKQKTEN